MVAPIKPKKPELPSLSFVKDGLDQEPITGSFTINDIVANLELLYVKAKNFHWNVVSPNFLGLHKTFDGIQEVALDWADTFAERGRALDQKIDSRSASFLRRSWFPEARDEMTDVEMIEDMVLTLTCISTYLNRALREHMFDAVTENKVQDLCAEIDKQNYFVKSNQKYKD